MRSNSFLLYLLAVLAFSWSSQKAKALQESSALRCRVGGAMCSSRAAPLFIGKAPNCSDNILLDKRENRSCKILSKQRHFPKLTVTSGILPVLLAATVFTTVPMPVMAAGDISRGAILFNSNCASCHRGGENIMKPAKTLQENDLIKNLGSADQATIAKFFTNSLNHKLLNFPNVPGGKLSETDVLDVTTYVSDQAMENKWWRVKGGIKLSTMSWKQLIWCLTSYRLRVSW